MRGNLRHTLVGKLLKFNVAKHFSKLIILKKMTLLIADSYLALRV